MSVLDMCFACPAFYLLVIDPTFPPVNFRSLGTDLPTGTKGGPKGPGQPIRVLYSPGHGDWFRHVTKSGQSEPLDLTSTWINTFPFFLKALFLLLPLANEKAQTNTIMNEENCSNELCPLYNSFLLFLSLFSPLSTQLHMIVDCLNLALSFHDIVMRQQTNLRISLAPGKLHCNSTPWYLEIKVKSLVSVAWTEHTWTDLKLTPYMTHTTLCAVNISSIIFCMRSKCYDIW